MPDTFPLGSIPALSAWEGEPLRFTVSTTLGSRAKFSKRAMPSPKGKISINPVTGDFTYEPSAEDKEEFDVWIRARNGAKEESQKITITPVTQVTSEFNVIEHASEKPPNPNSTFYTNFAQEDAGEMRFNHIEEVGNGNTAKPKVMTKKITVSGVKLVIEESTDDGSIYNRLKGRDNLRELTLCADEIVIRCELLVPGTDVHIYARVLRFEDTGGKKSRINTMPLAFRTNSTLNEGLDGQKGGDVYLYVKSLETPGNIIRILASGSKGQDARWGTPGAKGVDARKWDNKVRVEGRDFDFTGWYKWREWGFDGDEEATFVKVYEKVGSKREFRFDWPAVNWPTSGTKPTTLPGKPGRGGDGGSVYTQLKDQLANRVTLNAGGAGDKATNLAIPGPGLPRKAIAMEFQYEKAGMKIVKFYPIDGRDTEPGEGAVAPAASGSPAKPGEIKPLTGKAAGPYSWLHPAVVRAVISYANDAYLAGHTEDVQELLRIYVAAVKGASDADRTELAWPLLLNQLTALNLRIESPYDYFGNPAGWVPMLSFQANHQLFKNELESSIRAMFLAYWIQYTQDRAKSAADMLKAAKDRLHAETEQALADYNAAELKVTSLEAEMASIADQIEATRKFVSGVKDTLTAQVKNDLKTEHMLRASAKVLGGVMQLIPVGQPVLGSFGKALTVLGDIDIDKPADSLGGIAGAFAPVMTEVVGPKAADKAKALLSGLKQKEQLAKTEAETKAEEKKQQFDKALAKKELEKKVKDHMEKKEKAKDTIINGFSQFAVSEDDIKERLEKVLADTPAYKEAVTEIESLNKRKGAFTEELLATIQAIDVATSTIVTNQLAILELHDQRDRKLEQLNLEALQSVQDMGRKARERLLLYQYYLLKSYHYLMLEDLPIVDFQVQKLFDAFVKMVIEKPGKPTVTMEPLNESSNGMLTPAQYEALSAVFEAQLRAIAERIIGFYQGSQGRSMSNLLVQLTPNQVETLNSDAKRVDIDLLWELDFKEEDVRITGIEVDSINLADPLPTRAANLSLEYVHDGVSKLRRDGQLYLFRCGQYRIEGQVKRKTTSESSAPRGGVSRTDIHWGSKVTYNPNPGENRSKLTVTTTEPDPEEESLVRYLIGAPTTEKSPMMSFRPGAWTSLAVKRSGADSAKIKNLTLKVNYVFQSVDDDVYTTVGVKVADDAQPYVRCSVPDANGRTDGVGSFLRTFNKNKNKVTVTAPWRYGNRLFRGWRVGTDPGEEGPFRDDQLTRTQSVELNLQKSPYTILGAVFAAVNYDPVNDKGEAWPSCPVGWVFDDWLFINKSKAVIHIRKLSVDPWKDLRPEDPGITPEVCEPQGTNIAKLSFDKLTLLAGETAKLSVCLNPEFPDTPQPQVKFVWQNMSNQTYYTAFFSGNGNTTRQAKWNNGWVAAEKEIKVDQENRVITFEP